MSTFIDPRTFSVFTRICFSATSLHAASMMAASPPQTLPDTTLAPAGETRVAIQNVGCKLNNYEVESLKSAFGARGYRVVGFDSPADVYVVNTCTVTGSGDADSRKALRRAKRGNNEALVVATGCYAQRRPEELVTAGAGLVLGNAQKAGLVATVESVLAGGEPPNFDPHLRPFTEEFLAIEGVVPEGRTRGTLQIQDGCDEHCTYCIIPRVRGSGSSRDAEEIIAQARQMVDMGYREIALTGVHSGSYGYDRDRPEDLVELLQGFEAIPGLRRIRLNSIEPGYISDELVEFAANSKCFCRHFHIPLQSGDDHILRRMGRRYTSAYYADRIFHIAESLPDCAIGADVMVGFPGEEDRHFQETCELLESLPMTYLHVFTYSLREDTPAQRLPNHQVKAVKSDRARHLIELGQRMRLEFHKGAVGTEVEVLVESKAESPSSLARGMTDNYIRVSFAAGPSAKVNDFVSIHVERAREDLVFGSQR
ncbi:MAG: tRNA (N(6)-L-threonylcarbamoyladenosine(37)-C(2))-methylthiotransferase MtaB [Candidatus Latescibacterota bacterium]|nr:tRNA (N(6)-L-threonylcarbamoyladenosine(37)-C(2))-methylthiotransferase MtaB [Candidatus Latescibacterota bacterium]